MRNGSAGCLHERLRLARPSLAEQDFGLQELKFEEPVGIAEIAAELDTLFGLLQSLGQVAAPLCLLGSAVQNFRRLPANEAAARRNADGQAAGDQKPRRRYGVPLPPTPPPPPLPGFFSSSRISCTHCAVLAGI